MNNKLYIVHTNDIHGYAVETDTAIGYAKIAGLIDQYRAKGPTLALDAGDSFQGSVYAAFDGSESLMDIINSVGYHAAAAGNADIYLARQKFCHLAGRLEIPVLAANLKLKNMENLENVEDYKIVDVDGIKVGIIGLTHSCSLDMVQNSCIWLDPVDTAKEIIAKIGDQVDVLVGLVHLGTGTYPDRVEVLAEGVPEFDILIDAHSHHIYDEIVNGVPIVQTGSFGTNVGVVEIDLQDGKVSKVQTKLIPKEDFADIPNKPETKALADKLLADFEVSTSEVVGETTVFLDGNRGRIRVGETNLGNLFADAMREHTGAEAAITYSAFISGEFQPGPITQGNILQIARIEQMVLTVEITGQQILDGLNHSVSLYPDQYGLFFQVSGITFSFDPSRHKDDRIVEVRVNGAPLDNDKTYQIACCESLNLSLVGFKESKRVKEWDYTGVIVRQYFDKHKTVSPAIEGRINIIGK
jgi:5''-nucleotidase/2'',3''-cyclic phosphodiesterase and related esterases